MGEAAKLAQLAARVRRSAADHTEVIQWYGPTSAANSVGATLAIATKVAGPAAATTTDRRDSHRSTGGRLRFEARTSSASTASSAANAA